MPWAVLYCADAPCLFVQADGGNTSGECHLIPRIYSEETRVARSWTTPPPIAIRVESFRQPLLANSTKSFEQYSKVLFSSEELINTKLLEENLNKLVVIY